MSRSRPARRERLGHVSLYLHHGAWWIYYRQAGQPVRRRISTSRAVAERAVADVNQQLRQGTVPEDEFRPLTIAELRERFLIYHREVLKSSLATIRRYASATAHLSEFAGHLLCHQFQAELFVTHLRHKEISANGHPHTRRRKLLDKGLQTILQTCRSLFAYGLRMRHFPPYAVNPFAALRIERMQIENSKPVFVFTQSRELEFFGHCDRWSFPIHFVLSKTGLRVGELVHLLIEDLDLATGWLHIRNKPELGWQIKTRNARSVPLIPEVIAVLKWMIGTRKQGPVCLRHSFQDHHLPQLVQDRAGLVGSLKSRQSQSPALTREQLQSLARQVWRDAGVVKPDRIRTSFIRAAQQGGWPEATCPKSWRHSFATLLQDANVDPLIRQLTLGHQPPGAMGALGMTSVYTHTRPQTQRQEIERALRLWPASLEFSQTWLNTQGGIR